MCLHPELPQHPVDQDFQVQLAHAADQRLAGLVIDAHAESGIFFGQPAEGVGQLVLVRLRFRLNRNGDHRLRNSMASSTTGAPGSHSVSPVEVCLTPTIAPMSPARMTVTSSRFSA